MFRPCSRRGATVIELALIVVLGTGIIGVAAIGILAIAALVKVVF